MPSNIVERCRQDRKAGQRFVIGMLVLFVISNVVALYAMEAIEDNIGYDEEHWIAAAAGVIYALVVGQAICHSVWSVLSDQGGVKHYTVTTFTSCILYFSFIIPFLLTQPIGASDSWYVVLGGLMVLPVILVGCQSPFWILKAGFHWRISRPNHQTRTTHHHLSIAGLLIATTAIAVAIACLRAGTALDLVALDEILPIPITLVIFTLLAGVPQLFLLLWLQRIRRGFVLTMLWMPLLLTPAVVALEFVVNRNSAPQLQVGWLFFAAIAGGAYLGSTCFLTTPLLFARLIGMRLHRGNSDKRGGVDNR